VVATAVAADGLHAGGAGELFIAAGPSSFCSALTEVLNDPQLRSATGMAAVDFVRRNYDNHANTAELLEFYRRLIHGR